MATIKKLSDALIDQIAAGEVVDRPASAVKELTENAIDAGAEKIEIRLTDGGISSIWVKDDGQGMAEADILACTDRHATSKVTCFDDLYSLATMGFRGEALASIAAVSQFTVRSRQKGSDTGHQLVVSDGQKTLSPWSGSEGTAITVAELFGSVPARRKFLKKPAAEYLACLDTLTALALANPQVAMTLHHQDKLVFSYSKGSLKQRVEQVWQQKLQGKGLLALNARHNLAKVEGYISPPGLERGTGKDIFLFVNGRTIKDQKLRYAVLRGYHSHLLKGRFPMVVLRLTIDPSLVDVNVSPAKTEIRLQYSDEITAFISGAIKDAIREGHWAQQAFEESPSEPPRTTPARQAASSFTQRPPAPSASPRAGSLSPSSQPLASKPVGLGLSSGFSLGSATGGSEPTRQDPSLGQDLSQDIGRDPRQDLSQDLGQLLGPKVKVSSSLAETPKPFARTAEPDGRSGLAQPPAPAAVVDGQFDFNDLTYIGTFFKCYLAYEYGDRLLFIDQHAFHERILYEKLKGQHEAMLSPQPLLIAEGCGLTQAAVADIIAAQPVLSKMGFGLAAQGEQCIEVSALPALLHRSDPLTLLEDVAAVLASYDEAGASTEAELTDTLYHDLYATIACHSAIRSGELLAEHDRRQLEQEAAGVDFYLNCPHGRRVFKWLHQREVAGWFDRT